MRENSLKNIITDLDMKIMHIEDTIMDYRDILIKLVKQNNQIVTFLKQLELHEVSDEFEDITSPPISEEEKLRFHKMEDLKEMVEDFMDKHKDLKEFEEELEKHKDELTPGTIGES